MSPPPSLPARSPSACAHCECVPADASSRLCPRGSSQFCEFASIPFASCLPWCSSGLPRVPSNPLRAKGVYLIQPLVFHKRDHPAGPGAWVLASSIHCTPTRENADHAPRARRLPNPRPRGCLRGSRAQEPEGAKQRFCLQLVEAGSRSLQRLSKGR